MVCWLLTFFIKKNFKEHYQSVKQFGSRSGPTFCRPWSGSKLFAKVISRWQKSPLARKKLTLYLLVLSAYNLCKQFGTRSGQTKTVDLNWIQTAWHSDGIPERIILKKKISRWQYSMQKYPVGKELNCPNILGHLILKAPPKICSRRQFQILPLFQK